MVLEKLPDPKEWFLNFLVNMWHHGAIGFHNNSQLVRKGPDVEMGEILSWWLSF